MTFEQFEKAKSRELREKAKECFDECYSQPLLSEWRSNFLLESQFYVSEIERRASSRVALRDLILEIVVIILIGVEIILAIKQGKDQDVVMDKQLRIFGNLDTSTSKTATTLQSLVDLTEQMKANTENTVRALGSLKSTTER